MIKNRRHIDDSKSIYGLNDIKLRIAKKNALSSYSCNCKALSRYNNSKDIDMPTDKVWRERAIRLYRRVIVMYAL